MKELELYLDGVHCGRIEQSSSGNLTFHYEQGYRAGESPTPLSLSMPLSATLHKKRVILPYLQGLLPDSDEALRSIARRFEVSAKSPFALLEHVGVDVAGAVQVVAPGSPSSDQELLRESVRRVTNSEVAAMLTRVVVEYTDGTPYSEAAGRFSLAGAQPKIALHKLPDDIWGVPEDATPTTHILKPVAGSFRRLDVVENMTMNAAARLGNEVAQSELVSVDEWNVFVTRRYDRALVNGRWRRVHQEDMCQALAVSPDKKYQHRDGGPGLADIARLIRSFPFESDRRAVADKFYRAVVFNVVAGCTDAHAKNYSLLLDGSSVRLAPLYDLTSYAAYWDGRTRLNSAMNVGGAYALDQIGVEMLVNAGKQFGVGSDAAVIVEDVRSGVLQAFDAARASVEDHGAEVVQIADDLMRGLRQLPLVKA